MKKQLITGSTKECLLHIGSLLQPGDRSVLRPIADFVGVSVSNSVYFWVKGKSVPEGMSLLKVRCFLEQAGYTVTELASLSPDVKNFVHLVGYGVITIPDGTSMVGLKPKTLLQILIGRNKTSSSVEAKMRAVYSKYEEDLKAKMFVGAPQGGTNGSSPLLPPIHDLIAPDLLPMEEKKGTHSDGQAEIHALTMKSLRALIESIIPLAGRVLSDEYSPEERRHLREIVDVFGTSNRLNELASLMNQLCSESARKLKTTRWHNAAPQHQ